MNQDDLQAMEDLKRMPGLFEVYHVSTFLCARKRTNGGEHMVRVEIRDAGPDPEHHHTRYNAVATDLETGRQASGNGGPDVRTALGVLHWYQLDKE